jgi:hypothetical protein
MPRLATPLSALAVAGASLALAACGSSNDNSGTGNAASGQNGGGARNADFQKFQQCLKDNGVTLPDRGNGNGGGGGYGPPPTGTNGAPPSGGPGGGPGGFGGQNADPKTQKAMQACAKYRPQRQGNGNGNGNGRPQFNIKAFTPYLTCLKDQGLDVKVSDGFNALRGLKQDDTKVQAAFKACQSKLPQRRGGNATPSSSAPSNTTTNGTT